MRIEFEIDELVLSGFDPRDRDRIADELRHHLTVHFTRSDLPFWPPNTIPAIQRSGPAFMPARIAPGISTDKPGIAGGNAIISVLRGHSERGPTHESAEVS